VHELVGDFDGLGVVGQFQINVDRSMQHRQRCAAIDDKSAETLGRLTPVAQPVECQRQILDALLIAGFALQLLQAEPDIGVAAGRTGSAPIRSWTLSNTSSGFRPNNLCLRFHMMP
jgi:hypothetical protein